MDTLLSTGNLDLWLLLLGLFLPRLALFIAWLGVLPYPPNTLPNIVDFLGWLFLPRFLMAFYIYTNVGAYNLWFWLYVALGIAGILGESGYVHRRVIRRTTVHRDGSTTTTVEEEI